MVANTAFELIAQSSLVHRHVGWMLLEDLTRYKWNLISPEMCLSLRSRVFEAIDTIVDEETVESCARCVVSMMEQDWPQNWPDLNSLLQLMSSKSPLQCAVVFAIERRLVENVATLASISNVRRRKEMFAAMNENVSGVMTIALDVLQSSASVKSNILQVKNIFGWLIEVCSCITSTSLEDQLTRIVDVVVCYLDTAEGNIYEFAAKALAVLSARRRANYDNASVISAFFREEVFSAILSVTCLAADGSQSSEHHYRFLKSLCEVLTTLGGFLSKVWIDKRPPDNFSVYVSAIIAFFNHDSLFLKNEACEVLIGLSTQSSFRHDPSVVDAMQHVFSNIFRAHVKNGYPSQQPPSAASRYSQLDFDDDIEWHNFFIQFRSRLHTLIADNIEAHINHLVSAIEKLILQKVLSDAVAVSDIEWEAIHRFARNVIAVAYEKRVADKERSRLIAVRDAIVDFMSNVGSTNVLNEVFSLHSAFLLSYEDDWNSFARYFSLLKKTLFMYSTVKPLSRHVTSLILRAVQTFPAYFKEESAISEIVSFYGEVDGVISQMQMAQLLQVLGVLSNITHDESLRIKLLQMAIAPSVGYLQSVKCAFESVSSFISFNAFDAPPAASKEMMCSNRAELRRALTCIQGVMHQVATPTPLGTMLVPVFPLFFHLTRCLMGLHLSEAQELLHPLCRDSATEMVASERQQIYCSIGENIDIIRGRAIAVEEDSSSLERHYVHDLNDQIVTIITTVCKFSDVLYDIEELPKLLNGIVSSIESVPEFRLRVWIKKSWKSIICECPPERWPSIREFFEQIVDSMYKKLKKLWKEVSQIDYDSEPTEEQLFREHLTCAISRDYILFLRSCYIVNSADDRRASESTPLGDWLYSNKIGLSSVIMTLFEGLSFRDSQMVLKSIGICKVFAEKLVSCYDDEVGVFMLISTIRSLQVHGGDEVAGAPLLDLVFHVYFTLRRFSDSFPQILLQVPDVTADIVEDFDSKVRIMVSGDGVIQDKHKKEMVRRLLSGVIAPNASEQYRKPVCFRPLPVLEKSRRMEAEPEEDFEGVGILFTSEL